MLDKVCLSVLIRMYSRLVFVMFPTKGEGRDIGFSADPIGVGVYVGVGVGVTNSCTHDIS